MTEFNYINITNFVLVVVASKLIDTPSTIGNSTVMVAVTTMYLISAYEERISQPLKLTKIDRAWAKEWLNKYRSLKGRTLEPSD